MKKNQVYEIPADEYNVKLSKILKSMPEFKMPEWAAFVKTGVSRDRPPVDNDFWYKRAASILRQIYLKKVSGVNRLRTKYGGKQNRGMKPEKFRKASGKIIRTILQQAEQAELIEKHNIPGKRAGRKLTDKGKELLESVGINEKPITEANEKPITEANEKPIPIEQSEPIDSQKQKGEEEKQEAIKEISSEQPIDKKINNEQKKEVK